MIAIDAAAIEGLARVVTLRQRQFAMRIVVAAVIAGIFFGFTGWLFATLWFAAYVGLQLVELKVFAAVDPLTVLRNKKRYGATLALFSANTLLMGAFGLAEALRGGPWGLACACLLWAGSIMNSVVVSIGSKDAFVSQAVPAAIFYFSAPVFTLAAGAPWIDAGAVIMAGFLNLLIGATVWAAAQRHYEAETQVRDELARKTREAEAATAAKSAFIAMVSHELRTPISAILAGAGEIERITKDAEVRSHGLMIHDSARMLRTLLNDLLDVSKIEAGRMTVEKIPFDLRLLILDTIRLWSPEAKKKGLKLRLRGAGAVPRWVAGDPIRLRQILNNLLSNAVKFTAEGSVTLTIDAVLDATGELKARFRVKDTGPGLTNEQHSRLFRAFEQLGASTARKHGGTGLGLCISRDLARLMGGDIEVASRPGEGATFTLHLPLGAAEAPEDEPVQSPAARDGRPLRILLVDDHESNRRAFTLMLRALEADVEAVDSGRAALDALALAAFDLVLMDVNMPGLGGLEATRKLRRGGGRNARVPVIALTGHDTAEAAAACRAAGMNGFVTKPVEIGELMAAIRRALDPLDDLRVQTA